MEKRLYSPEEDKIIVTWRGRKTAKQIAAMLPGRDEISVNNRIRKLFYGHPALLSWSEAELRILEELSPEGMEVLKDSLPGRSYQAITKQAARRGIEVKSKWRDVWLLSDIEVIRRYLHFTPRELKVVIPWYNLSDIARMQVQIEREESDLEQIIQY